MSLASSVDITICRLNHHDEDLPHLLYLLQHSISSFRLFDINPPHRIEVLREETAALARYACEDGCASLGLARAVDQAARKVSR